VLRDVDRELLGHEKLVTNERTIRLPAIGHHEEQQLEGSEIMAGGSHHHAMDHQTLETTCR